MDAKDSGSVAYAPTGVPVPEAIAGMQATPSSQIPERSIVKRRQGGARLWNNWPPGTPPRSSTSAAVLRPFTARPRLRTLAGMEVRLTPELEAKLDRLASETGREKNEFVLDAMAGYFNELAQVRETLDSCYDDLKSGKVKPMDGEEAFQRLMEKTEAPRNRKT
jgi:predicted DNA-binding protein